MSTRLERAEDTRARIVSAARSLFREHGFARCTTDQIASRASVAKGTVFLHARTKERLLLLVFESDLAYATERALSSADVNASLPRALAGVFGYFFRLYEEDVALAREFVKQQTSLQVEDHGLNSITTRVLVGLEIMIQVRQRRGEVAVDVNPGLAARASFGVYQTVLLGWLGGWLPDAEARDAELIESLEMLWRGLARPPG